MFPIIGGLFIIAVLGGIGWLIFGKKRPTHIERGKRLVVITANSQSTIEWWIRSHMYWNWLRGNMCHCTCIDLGSTDDTLHIMNRLQRRYHAIELIRYEDEARTRQVEQLVPRRLLAERPVILDLRHDPQNASSLLQQQ